MSIHIGLIYCLVTNCKMFKFFICQTKIILAFIVHFELNYHMYPLYLADFFFFFFKCIYCTHSAIIDVLETNTLTLSINVQYVVCG